jgi:Nuclease A inhibitor-like protein
MSSSPIIAELKKATKELTYQSESDYPAKPLSIKGDGRKSVKSSDLTNKKPVKQIDFDG